MLQASTLYRNAMLDAIETVAGANAKIMFYTGPQPSNTAAAEQGTLLAEFDLATDWASDASGGAKSLNNLPLEVLGVASGIAGHFRLVSSAGVCHLQGSIVQIGSGAGDMVIDNTNIAQGEFVQLLGYTIGAPMA